MPPSPKPASLGPQRPKRTILLVEDHPAQRETIRRRLVETNFHVEVATDFLSAIRILKNHVPDLFCLDMTLPRESGLELCELIRSDPRFRPVPILMMGDRNAAEDRANAEEAGANAFLKKPFTRDELVKYVVALLDGPQGGPDGDPPLLHPAAAVLHRELSA